jgi:hypothetical protein
VQAQLDGMLVDATIQSYADAPDGMEEDLLGLRDY